MLLTAEPSLQAKDWYFLFMSACLCVLCACKCLSSPEEGVRSTGIAGTGGTVSYVGAGETEPGSFVGVA